MSMSRLQQRQQPRNRTSTPTTGSATQTITSTPTTDTYTDAGVPTNTNQNIVLRLRGAHNLTLNQEGTEVNAEVNRPPRRRIQWDTNVIDNEGLGRKKSKVCCIYHKPRAVGESSDESSDDSSSDSDSDSDSDSGPVDGARPSNGSGGRRNNQRRRGGGDHGHDGHGDECGRGYEHNHGGKGGRRPSPNAYEKMPKYDVKPLEKQPGT